MSFHYTLTQLKKAKNHFREYPEGTVKINHDNYFPQTFDCGGWHYWLRGCINVKINRNAPMIGRKHDPEWWTEMRRAQALLNTPRLRIYWLPKDVGERFRHRLCERGEI